MKITYLKERNDLEGDFE